MADPNLLASILAGQDPLSPQMLQGQQGAQLSASAADPEYGRNQGIAGAIGKTLASFLGHDMQNQAVQGTTQARLAAQPDLARLMASPNAYQDLAQNPQGYNPIARSAFLNGGPQQAQQYQLGQQEATGRALQNLAALSQVRSQAAALGGAMPNAGEIRSGAYQGPDWTKQFSAPGTAAPGGGGAAGGNISDPRGLVPYIRLSAVQNNIDPDVAVRVASSEGLSAPAGASGDGGTSGNAFQLHVTPGGKGGAVGDMFQAQTGLNPLDPANEKATIDFALQHAAKNGWGAWAGATKAGIAPFQGIAAAGKPMQMAQAGGGSATDALAAVGGQPQPQVAQAGGTALGNMTPAQDMQEAYRQQAILSARGVKISEPVQDYLSAMMLPPGQGRDIAISAAYSKAGIKPFIGGERRGSPIFKLNPQTGSYELAVQNPQLPEGAIEDPTTGALSLAPHALDVIGGVESAKAGAKVGPEIAIEQHKPQQIQPGHGLYIPPYPGAASPAPVQAPSVGGGLAAGGAIPGAAGGPAQPPGSTANVPGMVIPGMTPGQISEQHTAGEEVGKKVQENINMGAAAKTQNALLSRMVQDVGNFPQGPLGPAATRFQSYLRTIDPTYDQPVATAEEFNKDSGTILRQAATETSKRMAVQEYQLIGKTFPGQETSPMGTIRVANQLRGMNDYQVAKVQAQGAWQSAHNGSAQGFEADWQNKASPDAFLMYRMTPQDRQSTIQQLQGTEEGRATLKTLTGQMQYLKDSGLEHTIQ
jgi:hypothetical protein